MSTSYKEFIIGLEKIFGAYDQENKRFSDQSNSVIARELFYSDSQFSRLINQTASEGEYLRALKIISRYSENLSLKRKLKSFKTSTFPPFRTWISNPFIIIPFILSLLIAVYIGSQLVPAKEHMDLEKNGANNPDMDHMLKWAFEDSDVSPYTPLNDLPEDCDYPCYRLQGKWQLEKPYKFPVFGEKSGFHYLATEVNMYARCMSENDSKGTELEGYEYQKHEIWYDINEHPIDSFLYNSTSSDLKESYLKSDFSTNENFVKVADVHTFFRNVFTLTDNTIERKGKVIGRYIEYKNFTTINKITTQLSTIEIENYIKSIVTKRVQDYSKPIQCSDGQFDRNSVYDIEEEDLVNFECIMTTGRVPISYEKTYLLKDQAIKNHCRPTKS